MRLGIVGFGLAAVLLWGCGEEADEAADESTTTTVDAETTTTRATTSTTTAAPVELDITATQYVGIFNAQLPMVADDGGVDLRLDPVTDGVYGGTVDLGTSLLVFADSPAARITSVAVIVDLDATGGQTPAKLVAGASFGLDNDDPAGVVEAFNAQVVPALTTVTERSQRFELGAVDLLMVVEGDSTLVFAYVAPGGALPAYLE